MPPKKEKEEPKAAPVEVAPVTSIQSSGTVATETAPPPPAVASDQGPRQAGARRSRERQRGGKSKKANEPQ